MDILNELRLTRDNISTLLKIENETEDTLKESLEADAQTRMNVSKVNLQYMFALNDTNRTEIIDGIYEKLSALTQDKIQDVLVTKVNQEVETAGKENIRYDREIRKEDVTPVKTEVKEDRRVNRKED
jgi:hypothetical protein